MKAFGCTIAAVGLAVLLVPTGGPKAAEQDNASCQNSNLTSVRFLDLIDTLAWHGNLRDIWFTQALLGVMFELDPTVSMAKRYRAKSLFGIPVNIILDVYPEAAPPEFSRLNGEIDFQELPACLGLEEAEFEARFHGAMMAPPPPPNPPAPGRGTPNAGQPSSHEVGRDFRGLTGAYMRLADFHLELLRSRPVYRIRLSEIQFAPSAKVILPPFRWQIGPQAIQPLGNGYTINAPGQQLTVCKQLGNGFVCN